MIYCARPFLHAFELLTLKIRVLNKSLKIVVVVSTSRCLSEEENVTGSRVQSFRFSFLRVFVIFSFWSPQFEVKSLVYLHCAYALNACENSSSSICTCFFSNMLCNLFTQITFTLFYICYFCLISHATKLKDGCSRCLKR